MNGVCPAVHVTQKTSLSVFRINVNLSNQPFNFIDIARNKFWSFVSVVLRWPALRKFSVPQGRLKSLPDHTHTFIHITQMQVAARQERASANTYPITEILLELMVIIGIALVWLGAIVGSVLGSIGGLLTGRWDGTPLNPVG